MLKKSFFFSISTVFLLSSLIIQAQTSETLAKIKYTLADYKNPSSYKGRYGLIRFSSDDKILVVAGNDEHLIIYDSETGKMLQKIKYGGTGTNAFSFGADEKSFLLQDVSFTRIEVLDLETGKIKNKIAGRSNISGLKSLLLTSAAQKHKGLEMRELPVSPDRKMVLTAKTDSLYQVVDLESGEVRFNLEQTSKTNEKKDLLKMLFIPGAATTPLFFHISDAAYNADGKRIVLANGDKIPTLWDGETGKLIAKLEPQVGKVYQVSFSANGKLAATTDIAGITKIWDAETGAHLSTIGTPESKEIAVEWSPTAEVLATFSSAEEIHFYDARTGKLISDTDKTKVRGLSFSPNGTLAATIAKEDKNNLGQIFSVADGKLIAALPRLKKEEHALALEWNNEGNLLAVSSEDYVKIFNDKGELLQTLENAVFPARFSSDGKILATGGKNDVGYVWQINQN